MPLLCHEKWCANTSEAIYLVILAEEDQECLVVLEEAISTDRYFFELSSDTALRTEFSLTT